MRTRFGLAGSLSFMLLVALPQLVHAQPLYDANDKTPRNYTVSFEDNARAGGTLVVQGRRFVLELGSRASSGLIYNFRELLLLWDARQRRYELVSLKADGQGAWQSCWGKRVAEVRACTGTARAARVESTANPADDEPTPVDTGGGTGAPENPGSEQASAVRCDASANAVRAAILATTNALRASARQCGGQAFSATGKLRWNNALATAARNHSNDMATNNFFSHTGSDGLKAWDRAVAAGYSYRAIGENIAAGQGTVGVVQKGWIDSPGHCGNIMNTSYDEMGAACVTKSGSQYGRYWTVVLGKQR